MSAQTLEEFCDAKAPNVLICENFGEGHWLAIVQNGVTVEYHGCLEGYQYRALSPSTCVFSQRLKMSGLKARYEALIESKKPPPERFPEERNMRSARQTSNEFEVVVTFCSARAAGSFAKYLNESKK